MTMYTELVDTQKTAGHLFPIILILPKQPSTIVQTLNHDKSHQTLFPRVILGAIRTGVGWSLGMRLLHLCRDYHKKKDQLKILHEKVSLL